MHIEYEKKNISFYFEFRDKPQIIECKKWLERAANLYKMKFSLTDIPLFYFYEVHNFKTKLVKERLESSGIIVIYDEDILYHFMKKFRIGDPVFYKLRFGGNEQSEY